MSPLLFYYLHERILAHEYHILTETESVGPIAKQTLTQFPFLLKLASKERWLKVLKATQFDLLSFACYYSSLVYRIGHEELNNSIENDHSNDPLFWARYSRLGIQSLAFNMKRKTLKLQQGIDVKKNQSTVLFMNAVRNIVRAAQKSRVTIEAMKDCREGEELWWQSFRAAPKYKDLHPAHSKTLSQACSFLATCLETVFSDSERFRRIEAIHKKIPQSFLITSLYIINPAPFIQKILPMFTWRPSGTLSLCQRMASSMCGVSKTQERLDQLGIQLDVDRKLAIDSLLENTDFSSSSPYEEYQSQANINDLNVLEEVEYLYTRQKVRLMEKMDYVEFLGKEGQSNFLDFMGEILPPLLNELAKVGSLATIVSSFFSLLNGLWDSLAKYKDDNSPTQEEMILQLAQRFESFISNFYPCLHKIAILSGTPKALPCLALLFDSLFGLLLGWKSQKSIEIQYHSKVEDAINKLDPDEQDEIWKHIDKIKILARGGIDEWPICEIMEKNILPICMKEYASMISNFS
jgi:hypothetical protein